MVAGSSILAGAMFGFHTGQSAIGGHTPMDAGFIPTIGAGTGSRMLTRPTGAGLLITMVAGSSIAILAGSGFQAMNGARPGLIGAEVQNTSAGRRYRRMM